MPEKQLHTFDILKAYKRGTLDTYWEAEKRTLRSIVASSKPKYNYDDGEIGVAAAGQLDMEAYEEYRLLIKTPQDDLDEEETLLRGMLPGNLDEITRYLMELCGLDTWIDEKPLIQEFLAEKLAEKFDEYKNWPKREDEPGYLVASEKLTPRGHLCETPVIFRVLADGLWEEELSPGEHIHIIALYHFQMLGHADYRFLGLGRIGIIEETGACVGLMERMIHQCLYTKDAKGEAYIDYYDKIL